MQCPGSPLREVITKVAHHISILCNSNITHEDIFAHLLAGRPLSTITPQLAAIGAFPTDAPKACLNAANELINACELSLRKTLSKAPMDVTQEEVRMINEVLSSNAQPAPLDTRKLLSDLGISNLKSTSSNLVKGKKPVFNHEYTPLLDKYFEYNAYPSAPDRAVLARKSMMTQRQIEVWFQNHRNRAKKEGRTLRRLADAALPAELSLSSLEHKMPFFTIPVHERKLGKSKTVQTDASDNEDNSVPSVSPQDTPSSDPLNPPRPLHAFPTIYSSPCGYVPFANRVVKDDFPPPIWPRTHAVPHPSTNIKNPTDMHGLVMDFTQKLHLRTPAPRKERSKATPSWCAARVTIASPAPHPALVRTYVPIPIPDLSRPLSAVASPTSHRAFQSQNLTPQSTTFSPSGGRKVAPLPRRRPISVARHRSESPITDDSPSAFLSSLSSTSPPPYLGLYPGSRRRVSSSSSSSSSSSGPSTPVQLEATLFENDFSPVVTSGLDSNAAIQFGIRGLGALVEQVSSSVSKKVPEGICPPLQRHTLRFAP